LTSEKILVVDDEEPIRRMLARILNGGGYRSEVASGVEEALALACDQEFALALCDINMPGGSGMRLVRELQSRHPDIAVVMVSGIGDPAMAAMATELGAYGYIVKPFDASEILIGTMNALRRRQLEIENRRHRDRLEALVAERTADLTTTIARLSATEEALRASQEEVVQRLAYAADFHDPTTGEHLNRMSHICEALALSAGLGEQRAELIRVASPMHDVGKIGISQQILASTRKLSPDEVNEMRRHPLIGSQILAGSDSELLRLGATIALTHHERYAGDGYPRGLAGSAIPLEGRIVAIADVYDALRSERPYKPAFSIEHAVEIMREERAKHFDPELLDLFLELVESLLGYDRDGPAHNGQLD